MDRSFSRTVPPFYRWLARKYPKVVVDAGSIATAAGFDNLYVDLTSFIGFGFIGFDNLYVDLTSFIGFGFIGFDNLFDFLDRLLATVRPRKLLYLAIAGTASTESPTQQFMDALSVSLHYYIHVRLNSAPDWRQLQVILSDGTVPGEAKAKIMSFICLQRNQFCFRPNTRHCCFGLDEGDLTLLALAAHEVHFSILRAEVLSVDSPKCFFCVQTGHLAEDCQEKPKRRKIMAPAEEKDSKPVLQFINIWTLRHYLELEFRNLEIDVDRVIDDFVFICSFPGCNFVKDMTALELGEVAIDHLMAVYKRVFRAMCGYLTDSGKADISRLKLFLQAVGSYEDAIYQPKAIEDDYLIDPSKFRCNLINPIKDEALQQKSTRFDMLFVHASHPLSPFIYTLDSNHGHRTETERAEVKEQIYAAASGGLNGYLLLSVGDPCPAIIRSPVRGVSDILDNQVLCSAYRPPDVHKHFRLPPPGVKFPESIVTLSDLKPAPVPNSQIGEEDLRLIMDNLHIGLDTNACRERLHYLSMTISV